MTAHNPPVERGGTSLSIRAFWISIASTAPAIVLAFEYLSESDFDHASFAAQLLDTAIRTRSAAPRTPSSTSATRADYGDLTRQVPSPLCPSSWSSALPWTRATLSRMRYVSYPSVGRPLALSQQRDELVMLLQASIEIANTERWALEIGDLPPPPSLQHALRTTAYEVTVVDVLHRVARRYFERHGCRAVWERPFRTSQPGRPEAIDIALFDAAARTETRLELGLYSARKLSEDSTKLSRLAATSLPDFETVENLLLLWEIDGNALTQATSRSAMTRFKRDADAAFRDEDPWTVTPILASSVDLFVSRNGASRCATAGHFELCAT